VLRPLARLPPQRSPQRHLRHRRNIRACPRQDPRLGEADPRSPRRELGVCSKWQRCVFRDDGRECGCCYPRVGALPGWVCGVWRGY
jgi:hypothetical protein